MQYIHYCEVYVGYVIGHCFFFSEIEKAAVPKWNSMQASSGRVSSKLFFYKSRKTKNKLNYSWYLITLGGLGSEAGEWLWQGDGNEVCPVRRGGPCMTLIGGIRPGRMVGAGFLLWHEVDRQGIDQCCEKYVPLYNLP